MFDLQMTVAPLAAFLVGILVSWSYKRRIAQHRERLRDLQETRKAMLSHYDAMDRIIAHEAVPEKIKRSMISVTNALNDRELAIKMCALLTTKPRSIKSSGFEDAVSKLRIERPDVMDDIETAMSSALFIVMLRWPETSKQFKQFVVSSMVSEHREATVFNRVAEIVRTNTTRQRLGNDPIESDGAYA